jgi:tetratricopeptide (TPR) repeat protein
MTATGSKGMARWIGRFGVALALLTAPVVSGAQTKDKVSDEQAAEAEALSARAYSAYKEGRFQEALDLYQQALDILPAAAIYFNVATIYEKKVSNPELAIEFYRKAIAAPDSTSDIRIKSTAKVQELTQELERARSLKDPEKPTDPQPPAPTTKPTPPDEAADDGASGEAMRDAGIGVGVVGLVTLGVGLGVGGVALSRLSTAEESCGAAVGLAEENQCTTQEGADALSSASDLATASTILVIVGGGVTVLGLGLFLFAPSDESEGDESMPEGEEVTLHLAPLAGPGHAGVVFGGKF